MVAATIDPDIAVRNRLSAAVSVALESVSTAKAMARPWSTSPVSKPDVARHDEHGHECTDHTNQQPLGTREELHRTTSAAPLVHARI